MMHLSATPTKIGDIFLIGCDMGGWHTQGKDALAVYKWTTQGCVDHYTEHGRLFFPLTDTGRLVQTLRRATEEKAKAIIAVDAALAWPVDFLKLAVRANRATHLPSFDPATPQIENRYLFRETERFIRRVVRRNKDPFSGPGDSFGNCCSKAQALVAGIKRQFPMMYRPPFDRWEPERAADEQLTLIEVYPAASMRSQWFCKLRFRDHDECYETLDDADDADNPDENDAKRCATTAALYAMTIGVVPHAEGYPLVWTPDEANEREYSQARIRREGWIFAPKQSETE